MSLSLMRKKKKNRTGAVLYTRWAWKNLTQSNKWQKKKKKKIFEFWKQLVAVSKKKKGKRKQLVAVVGSARELVPRTHVTRSALSSFCQTKKRLKPRVTAPFVPIFFSTSKVRFLFIKNYIFLNQKVNLFIS